MKYGSARVSTDGQRVAVQVTAFILTQAGADKVFQEGASGDAFFQSIDNSEM
jgi:hypothetical protein